MPPRRMYAQLTPKLADIPFCKQKKHGPRQVADDCSPFEEARIQTQELKVHNANEGSPGPNADESFEVEK